MLRAFGEKALTWRNLADQREARMATSWWKILSVPVSPDPVVVHICPSSTRTGIRESSGFLQNQCLMSHDADHTSKGLPATLSEMYIWFISLLMRRYSESEMFKISQLRQTQKMILI